MWTDALFPRVNVAVEVADAQTGALLDHLETHNLVVLAGRNLARDLLYWKSTGDDPRPLGLNWFGVGTSTVAATAADVALGVEMFRDQFTSRSKSDGQCIYQYYLGSGSANGNTLGEVGLFGSSATSSSGSGVLYARAVHTGVAKTASVAITYTWTLSWEV